MARFKISNEEITNKICQLVIKANRNLPSDVISTLKKAKDRERNTSARNIFDILLENARISMEEGLPICQDTGIYVVFVELGIDINIEKGFKDAINEGIRQATKKGFLRASVCDPITRKNTFDNTPAIIHTNFCNHSGLKLTVLPKGCGSENMSALKMLPPSSGLKGIADFVIDTVKKAGPNPCPPGIVGVGIGGTMEKAAYLSKKALLRPLEKSCAASMAVCELEKELLTKINSLGIGPQGLGGDTTTLKVAIETSFCHIASLPVAVNIQCHAARKASSTFINGEWHDMQDMPSIDNFPNVNFLSSFKDAVKVKLPLKNDEISNLKAGTWVLLSGPLLTGRDQTHKKLCEFIEKGQPLPVNLTDELIYYMGPSPAPPGKIIGSAGPTTSYRMDAYTPTILQQGVRGLMGKGKRSEVVKRAIKRYGAVYFATIGGAGALLSKAIKKCDLLAFKELGPEALFRLEVEDFPAIVINDSYGNDYYEMVETTTALTI